MTIEELMKTLKQIRDARCSWIGSEPGPFGTPIGFNVEEAILAIEKSSEDANPEQFPKCPECGLSQLTLDTPICCGHMRTVSVGDLIREQTTPMIVSAQA